MGIPFFLTSLENKIKKKLNLTRLELRCVSIHVQKKNVIKKNRKLIKKFLLNQYIQNLILKFPHIKVFQINTHNLSN